jgi:ferredoxin
MAVIHSLYREAGTVTIDDNTCKKCGKCIDICPRRCVVHETWLCRCKSKQSIWMYYMWALSNGLPEWQHIDIRPWIVSRRCFTNALLA